MILVVNLIWFEIQVIWSEVQLSWLPIDLRFNWFGCQLMCDCVIWGENEAFLRDFHQGSRFEAQKRSFSAKLPSKLKLWSSKTMLFCETFSQKWNFEGQKRSFCARLPSKKKLWSSKTKLLCETSFKNETLKIKNEPFVRDFLQKWNFEDQKRSFCARVPSKMNLWRSKTKHFCETSFKNDMLTRHLTSEFQYVLAIYEWMLQKYCACHDKVKSRHTKSCNCHAKWSLQSNSSVTWNLQPFRGFCAGGFKHRHRKARNPCACHAKRTISEPLQIHHACQRFCKPHELLHLQRVLQPVEIPAPATQNALSTSKNVPSTWRFNDFGFQIALARRRGANFAKVSEPTAL